MVRAEGKAYRAQAEISDGLTELQRQYPIVISTDGGATQRYLRPDDKTWYEQSSRPAGLIAIGTHPRLQEPAVSLTEEISNDVVDGRPTRRFVLKASCVVESDIDTETVRLHKSVIALFSVTDIDCAPRVAEQFGRPMFGIEDIDERVRLQLASIDGLIVRQTISRTERYDGGLPRTSITKTEVINVHCVDLKSTLFAVPKDYRHQEPIMRGPGR